MSRRSSSRASRGSTDGGQSPRGKSAPSSESQKTIEQSSTSTAEKITTYPLVTIFRQDKILSFQRDFDGNIYIYDKKKSGEHYETVNAYKLSEAEAALLSIKLDKAVRSP